MGIRFYCPNGHKLHVKDFQAGQKGICPVCGTKMQIPQTSTRPSSRQEEAQSLGGAAEGAASGLAAETSPPTVAPPLAPPSTAAKPAAEVPGQLPVSVPAGPEAATSRSSAAATFADSPPPAAVAGGGVDPLAEAGDVVWYVRPASGGQFGPATADVMRNWLDEGRISADTLVWREGWRDWQEAGGVFPQLSTRPTVPGLEDVVEAAAPDHGYTFKRRARARKTQVIVVVGLLISVIVLFAILLVIVTRQ